MGDKKESGIGNIRKDIMPPRPGQTGRYVYENCGERFSHKIPPFFDLDVKCPECGSFRVKRDPAVVY
jgi:hypothetical protein